VSTSIVTSIWARRQALHPARVGRYLRFRLLSRLRPNRLALTRLARDLRQLSGHTREVPKGTAAKSGGSGLLLEGLEGGQAERVAGRVGVDTAVVVRLEVVLRGTGR
jgi:hypothetical protein